MWKATTLLKQRLWHMCFHVNFAKYLKTSFRSSHGRCSVRKGILRNFAKFTRKLLCQGLFFNKVAGWNLQPYQKRDSGTGVFLWILRNFANTFFTEQLRWLLLTFFTGYLLMIAFVHQAATLNSNGNNNKNIGNNKNNDINSKY